MENKCLPLAVPPSCRRALKVHPTKLPLSRNTEAVRSSCSDKNLDKPERWKVYFMLSYTTADLRSRSFSLHRNKNVPKQYRALKEAISSSPAFVSDNRSRSQVPSVWPRGAEPGAQAPPPRLLSSPLLPQLSAFPGSASPRRWMHARNRAAWKRFSATPPPVLPGAPAAESPGGARGLLTVWQHGAARRPRRFPGLTASAGGRRRAPHRPLGERRDSSGRDRRLPRSSGFPALHKPKSAGAEGGREGAPPPHPTPRQTPAAPPQGGTPPSPVPAPNSRSQRINKNQSPAAAFPALPPRPRPRPRPRPAATPDRPRTPLPAPRQVCPPGRAAARRYLGQAAGEAQPDSAEGCPAGGDGRPHWQRFLLLLLLWLRPRPPAALRGRSPPGSATGRCRGSAAPPHGPAARQKVCAAHSGGGGTARGGAAAGPRRAAPSSAALRAEPSRPGAAATSSSSEPSRALHRHSPRWTALPSGGGCKSLARGQPQRSPLLELRSLPLRPGLGVFSPTPSTWAHNSGTALLVPRAWASPSLCLFSHPLSDGGKPSPSPGQTSSTPPASPCRTHAPSSPGVGGSPLTLSQLVNRLLVTGLPGGNDTPRHSTWCRRALTSAKQKKITFSKLRACYCYLCWLQSACCLLTCLQPLQQSSYPDRQFPICVRCLPFTEAECLSLLNLKKFTLACSSACPGPSGEPSPEICQQHPWYVIMCKHGNSGSCHLLQVLEKDVKIQQASTCYCPPGKVQPIKLPLSAPKHAMSFLRT